MKETAIDARVIGSTVKIEIAKKVEKKYRISKEDSLSVIYARALEDSVRGVTLTSSDYQDIADEMKRNQAKREANRRKNLSK